MAEWIIYMNGWSGIYCRGGTEVLAGRNDIMGSHVSYCVRYLSNIYSHVAFYELVQCSECQGRSGLHYMFYFLANEGFDRLG